MSFEPRDYLRHILEETDYLLRESSGLTVEEFLRDERSVEPSYVAWR
jgi:hypothetical protein